MQLAQDTVVAGRYRLLGRLGSGGMADVWCAEDSLLNRRVALKFLHPRFAQDQQFVERFRREASAAAGLQHPNVVGVFDRGSVDGTHYIAMEFVDGAANARSMEFDTIARVGPLTSANFTHSTPRPSFSENFSCSNTAPKPRLKPLVQ